MNTATATVASKDGTTIAFERSGSGPAIILVDGALCHRAFGPTGPLAPLLAPHFTVYRYDRRGRGESGDTAPYATEREVEDLGALIKEAGGSAFVFGISSGAALALEAAAHGLPITKLALWEPPYSSDNASQDMPQDLVARLSRMLAEGHRSKLAELALQGVGMPPEVVAQMRQSPMWPAMEAVAPTFIYDCMIMEDSSVPAGKLAGITIPTLVLNGGASPEGMRNTARAVADALPNAQRRTLEGLAHDAAPDTLAPALIAFFAA